MDEKIEEKLEEIKIKYHPMRL